MIKKFFKENKEASLSDALWMTLAAVLMPIAAVFMWIAFFFRIVGNALIWIGGKLKRY